MAALFGQVHQNVAWPVVIQQGGRLFKAVSTFYLGENIVSKIVIYSDPSEAAFVHDKQFHGDVLVDRRITMAYQL